MWPAAVVRHVVSSRLVVKDRHVAVACAVPPARDVQPAAAQARAVLEEQLVEVGLITDAESLGGDATGELAQSEMWRQAQVRIVRFCVVHIRKFLGW